MYVAHFVYPFKDTWIASVFSVNNTTVNVGIQISVESLLRPGFGGVGEPTPYFRVSHSLPMAQVPHPHCFRSVRTPASITADGAPHTSEPSLVGSCVQHPPGSPSQPGRAWNSTTWWLCGTFSSQAWTFLPLQLRTRIRDSNSRIRISSKVLMTFKIGNNLIEGYGNLSPRVGL